MRLDKSKENGIRPTEFVRNLYKEYDFSEFECKVTTSGGKPEIEGIYEKAILTGRKKKK